jgi:PPOX class probable F420-dependent enzyme
VDAVEARRRFAEARVGHLSTTGAAGAPHVVPFVFAVDGDRIFWAVDHKPKRSVALKRLENIAENPRVAALVDHYDDRWDRLWWVRADGEARLADSPDRELGLGLLAAKYPQYRERPPEGPVVVIEVGRWSGWPPD